MPGRGRRRTTLATSRRRPTGHAPRPQAPAKRPAPRPTAAMRSCAHADTNGAAMAAGIAPRWSSKACECVVACPGVHRGRGAPPGRLARVPVATMAARDRDGGSATEDAALLGGELLLREGAGVA